MLEFAQHHISAEIMFRIHVKPKKLLWLLFHRSIRFLRTYTVFCKLFGAIACILNPLQKLEGANSCLFGSTSIRAPEKLYRVHENSKNFFLHSQQPLQHIQSVALSVHRFETLCDFKTWFFHFWHRGTTLEKTYDIIFSALLMPTFFCIF